MLGIIFKGCILEKPSVENTGVGAENFSIMDSSTEIIISSELSASGWTGGARF